MTKKINRRLADAIEISVDAAIEAGFFKKKKKMGGVFSHEKMDYNASHLATWRSRGANVAL